MLLLKAEMEPADSKPITIFCHNCHLLFCYKARFNFEKQLLIVVYCNRNSFILQLFQQVIISIVMFILK